MDRSVKLLIKFAGSIDVQYLFQMKYCPWYGSHCWKEKVKRWGRGHTAIFEKKKEKAEKCKKEPGGREKRWKLSGVQRLPQTLEAIPGRGGRGWGADTARYA